MVQKTKLRNTGQLKQLAINKAIESVQDGKFTGALSTIRKHFSSEDPTSYFFKGWVSQLSGDHAKAIRYFEKSLVKNPLNQDALTGLVGSYLELGDFERAHECAEQCILLNKHDPRNLCILATVVSKRYRGDVDKQLQAIKYFSEAFSKVKSNSVFTRDSIELTTDILSGWGACLINLHQPQRAIILLEAALELDPLNPLVNKNLASAYTSVNDIKKAIDSARKAQRSDDPEVVADSIYQEGMLELMLGNYQKGWRLHEHRLHTKQFAAVKATKTPQWRGETLQDGESLLIYQEQGIGDTLQFSRYLPLISTSAKNIDIEVMGNQYQKWIDPKKEPNSIRQFLHNNYKEVVRNSFVKGWNSPYYEDYTYIVSFMSLPRIFRTTLESVPAIPNFKAYNTAVSATAADIGILWQGSKEHKNDFNRSIPLDYVKNLLNRHSDKTFISLQLEPSEELQDIPNLKQLGHTVTNLDDTLTLLQSCKLVVTVDSMIAHLSGSANIPTVILHAYSPDWRWMLDRSDSPWYPSVTNIRQSSIQNWDSVFTALDKHLETVFSNKN
jgi:tetratricopeptide (TPR) repeat protein